MATDFGPSTGTGELFLPAAGVNSGVFLELHLQGPVTSGAVPGGLSGPASASGSLGPADYPTSDAQAYGTVSSGAAVTPIFNLGGTSASFGPVNPSGAGNLSLFRTKNPGIIEAFELKDIL